MGTKVGNYQAGTGMDVADMGDGAIKYTNTIAQVSVALDRVLAVSQADAKRRIVDVTVVLAEDCATQR